MSGIVACDLMTEGPVTVVPGATVLEAARLMAEHRIGALPVVDEGRLVGLVTQGDLIGHEAHRAYPTYIHLLDGFITYPPAEPDFEGRVRAMIGASVGEVMTTDVVSVEESTPLSEVASRIAECAISHLPVLADGAVVGIVSKHDIVRAIAEGLT